MFVGATTIQRILCIRPDGIGDMVCALPAFAALRSAHPEAVLDVLASPLNAAVIEADHNVSETLVYDARDRDRGVRGLYRTARLVRRRRYDAVIVMRTATYANALAAGSAARVRVGYGGKPGTYWLTRRLRGGHARHTEHEVDRSARLTWTLDEDAGDERAVAHPAVSVTQAERAWAAECLRELGVEDDVRIVGIHPGASSPDKCYPEGRCARAADEVAEAIGGAARVAVFEGPADGARADAIVAASGATVVRPGPGTLRQTMALMQRVDVMLVNDSGPMHLAAALGTPLAAVFGPTDDARWMPRQPTAFLVKPDATRAGALALEDGASNVRQIPPDWLVAAAMDALTEAGRNA